MSLSTEKTTVPLLLQVVIVSAAIAGATPALAADFTVTPSLTVSEEYNDNLFNSVDDKRSDFITRLQPGAALVYRAPSLNGDLSYSFDYHYYARGTRDAEKNHFLSLTGTAELVDNFFFLEVSDTLSRVSLDVTRDVTSESLFVNQTDQNRASVSPYLLWRLGEKSTLKTGYRFMDTSYWDSPGIDRREHRGFAELSYDPTARLNLAAGYSYTRVATALVDYDQHDLSTGFRYEFSDKSFLFGGIGNGWQSFSDSRNVSNPFWHAGVTRDFTAVVATLETRVQYAEDPLTVSTQETNYSARLETPVEDGAFGVLCSYSEYEDTQTGVQDRRRTAVSGFGRYQLSQRLDANVTLTGDKVSRTGLQGYPYHLSAAVGARYSFYEDLSASLSYSYTDYRQQLDSGTGARQTNRVILDARKVF